LPRRIGQVCPEAHLQPADITTGQRKGQNPPPDTPPGTDVS
jgi:hypothetical protein